MKENRPLKKIVLICSDGGHLAEILDLKEMFLKYNYLLVTEKSPVTQSLEGKYRIKFLKSRSKGSRRGIRFLWNNFMNVFLSLQVLIKHYPKVIITTGSHTAVPMCYIGKLIGVKIVWILTFARMKSRAFSADLVYPIADEFIIQWPGVKKFYRKSTYLGGIK